MSENVHIVVAVRYWHSQFITAILFISFILSALFLIVQAEYHINNYRGRRPKKMILAIWVPILASRIFNFICSAAHFSQSDVSSIEYKVALWLNQNIFLVGSLATQCIFFNISYLILYLFHPVMCSNIWIWSLQTFCILFILFCVYDTQMNRRAFVYSGAHLAWMMSEEFAFNSYEYMIPKVMKQFRRKLGSKMERCLILKGLKQSESSTPALIQDLQQTIADKLFTTQMQDYYVSYFTAHYLWAFCPMKPEITAQIIEYAFGVQKDCYFTISYKGNGIKIDLSEPELKEKYLKTFGTIWLKVKFDELRAPTWDQFSFGYTKEWRKLLSPPRKNRVSI